MRHPARRKLPAARRTRKSAGFYFRRAAGCVTQRAGNFQRRAGRGSRPGSLSGEPPDASPGKPDTAGDTPDAEVGWFLLPASRRMRHPVRRKLPATRRTRKSAGFSIQRLAGSIQRAAGCIQRPAGYGRRHVGSFLRLDDDHYPIYDEDLPDMAKLQAVARLGAAMVEFGHKVLSHCGMGFNRSALVAGLILNHLRRGPHPHTWR